MYLIKKIFSVSCLVLSVFIITYVFYKSQIYWNGENNSYYLFYHVASIGFFIFSVLLFLLKGEAKTYLIIMVISSFLSIYLFEVYLIYKSEIIEQKRIELKKKFIRIKLGMITTPETYLKYITT